MLRDIRQPWLFLVLALGFGVVAYLAQWSRASRVV